MICGMNGTPIGVQVNAFSTSPAAVYRVTSQSRQAGFQRSVDLQGPAGRLEATLNEGTADAPFAALVCHPHPLGGGTMHNKVVYHAMKVLNAPEWGFRVPVLRFNFRGAGTSGGKHDGEDEIDDVDAALDWLESRFGLPVVAAGFSFGAAMTLGACCGGGQTRKSIRALALVGLPTDAAGRSYSYPQLGTCTVPKLFLSGDHDQYAPAARLEELAAVAAEPKRVVLVRSADHFFSGQIHAMQEALAAWLREQTQ
jgi:alpha/beta superfamily hydrolase